MLAMLLNCSLIRPGSMATQFLSLKASDLCMHEGFLFLPVLTPLNMPGLSC